MNNEITMNKKYCHYYDIRNGKEYCVMNESAPMDCIYCSYFKKELYIKDNPKAANIFDGISELEGFVIIPNPNRKVKISINNSEIRLSQESFRCLKSPEYVELLLNPKTKSVMIRKSAKESEESFKISAGKWGHIIQSKYAIRKLSEHGNWGSGKYNEKHNCIIYTLTERTRT